VVREVLEERVVREERPIEGRAGERYEVRRGARLGRSVEGEGEREDVEGTGGG
jgi:hypothetical protein